MSSSDAGTFDGDGDGETSASAAADTFATDTPEATSGRAGAASITAYRDGPLIVRGDFEIFDADGNQIEAHRRTVALCRCGRSGRRPLCDGSHQANGWKCD